MQYASQNLIPVTLGARRQEPEHLLRGRRRADDDFFDKALEGFAMFALNQGEVCTCPSRALVQRRSTPTSWATRSSASRPIVQGNPLDDRR